MANDNEVAAPRRIIWEKWIDPLLAAVKDWKERTKGLPWEESFSQMQTPGQMMAYQGPMLMGPAGFIPLNELNTPSRNFNLWVAHCSFVIDGATLDRIVLVPGVEVVQVWSPYRMWIAVGKAFEENEVKKAVLVAAVGPQEKSRPSKTEGDNAVVGLEILKATTARKYKYWAVFVMSNGKLDVTGSDNREDVETEVKLRADKTRRVVTSWDKE